MTMLAKEQLLWIKLLFTWQKVVQYDLTLWNFGSDIHQSNCLYGRIVLFLLK